MKIRITADEVLWRKIERLWQRHLTEPNSPISFNEFVITILEKGLEVLKNEDIQKPLKNYREGSWRAVPQTKVKIFG